MSRRTSLFSLPLAVTVSWCLSSSPVAGAVVFETFTTPLAPNTRNFGPGAVANYFYQGKIYNFQWRLSPFAVDLDGNGTTDLTFEGNNRDIRFMHVSLAGENRVWATVYSSLRINAVGLPDSSFIGPSLASDNPQTVWLGEVNTGTPILMLSGDSAGPIGGEFGQKPFEQKYLGVRFQREGALHYGWLAISGGHIFNGQELYIHAWAYESEPGKGLIAGQIPEPGSSLLVAAGALLLGTRRRASSGNRR